MALLKRFPITAFFVLAFVLAWSIRITMNILSIQAPPLKLLAEYGPAVAALIVTAALEGKSGVGTLLSRVRAWRVNPWWYVVVLLGPATLQLLSVGVFVLLGVQGIELHFPGYVFLILLTLGILLSVGEEIGWRGFAFPHVQTRSNVLVSGLIIGALWAFWHVPDDITNLGLLASPSTYIAFSWFLGLTMAGSVLMGWVYNQTGGSILLMVLFHLGLTLFWNFVTLPERAGQFGPNYLATILMSIVALIIVVLTGVKKRALAQQLLEPIGTRALKSLE